jgi:hypothetical protein
MLEGERGEQMFAKGKNPSSLARTILRELRPTVMQMLHDYWLACRDADALLLAGASLMPGASIAAKLWMPFVQANVLPMSPTRAFPSALMPPPKVRLGGAFNLLTHALSAQASWQSFRPLVNAGRREVLGMPTLPLWTTLASIAHGSPCSTAAAHLPSPGPLTGATKCTSPAIGSWTTHPIGSHPPPWWSSCAPVPRRSTSASAA